MRPASTRRTGNAADLRGAGALAIDGVTGVVDLVEAVHATIAGLPWMFGRGERSRAAGIAGLVYRSIRGTTRWVGGGIDATLAAFAPLLDRSVPPRQREAVVAALNGVLGDRLAATGNPLAITMRLRIAGRALELRPRALARSVPRPGTRVLLLAHGLCMNDHQWQQRGHDHGAALARDLGYAPVYLHYNTGLPVAENGHLLSAQLEALMDAWPVPVEELAIVCHSMGGLVARAACLAAQEDGSRWLERLQRLVFLGTPHHGAPLEQAGTRIDALLGISPYSAPFARLGGLRSTGIRDLRHGNVRASDGDSTRDGQDPQHSPAPLPVHVRAYAIAATTQAMREGADPAAMRGDGLVRVDSAFGRHPQRRYSLRIPASRRALVHGTNHFELLGSAQVYAHLLRWLR